MENRSGAQASKILHEILADYKRGAGVDDAKKSVKALSLCCVGSELRAVNGVLGILNRLQKYDIRRIRREAVDFAALLGECRPDLPDIDKAALRKQADCIYINFVSRLFKDRAMMFEVVTWQEIFTCLEEVMTDLLSPQSEVA